MFGSDFPKTNCYFRAVNIFFSAMRFNARYAVAAFVIIRNVLYVFGGDVSGFFAVEHNGKSGLPFKFFADKDYFRFFVIEGRVLPIQAAKNRLSAFPPVLKRNASNVRFKISAEAAGAPSFAFLLLTKPKAARTAAIAIPDTPAPTFHSANIGKAETRNNAATIHITITDFFMLLPSLQGRKNLAAKHHSDL